MDIHVNEMTHLYMPGTPFEQDALKSVNLTFSDRQWTTVVGRTGSGKSTFIQHLNGLLKPYHGSLTVKGVTITRETKQRTLHQLRKKVGMVFQFPEQQLFAEEVITDVMYGPLNLGKTKDEARALAEEALSLTGIDPSFYDQSPFELSGGQMRRVAIAGVMAMDPELLILDEPTAGLDPDSHVRMMAMFHDWYSSRPERGVVLVTHQMQDAARFSDEVLVMHGGRLAEQETPEALFLNDTLLKRYSLSAPPSFELIRLYMDRAGMQKQIDTLPLTAEDTADALKALMARKETEGADGDV